MTLVPELFKTLSSVARTLAGALAAPTIQSVTLRELNLGHADGLWMDG